MRDGDQGYQVVNKSRSQPLPSLWLDFKRLLKSRKEALKKWESERQKGRKVTTDATLITTQGNDETGRKEHHSWQTFGQTAASRHCSGSPQCAFVTGCSGTKVWQLNVTYSPEHSFDHSHELEQQLVFSATVYLQSRELDSSNHMLPKMLTKHF